MSQLNMIADQLAKHYWQEKYHLYLKKYKLSKEGWSINYKKNKLSSIDKLLMYEFLTKNQAWNK